MPGSGKLEFRAIARTFACAGLTLGLIAGLAACATEAPLASKESISIPYDPYNYDPEELYQQATAHCGAYRLRAVYRDETIDPSSVRWRYKHFDCV